MYKIFDYNKYNICIQVYTGSWVCLTVYKVCEHHVSQAMSFCRQSDDIVEAASRYFVHYPASNLRIISTIRDIKVQLNLDLLKYNVAI
jgi:hypothetical protein